MFGMKPQINKCIYGLEKTRIVLIIMENGFFLNRSIVMIFYCRISEASLERNLEGGSITRQCETCVYTF